MSVTNGIITALVTPFNSDGSLNNEELDNLVEDQICQGIHGLCILGGTGEPLMLSLDERKLVIDVVIKKVKGRVLTIVGSLVGSYPEIVDVLQYGEKAGADAGMIMPPYFIMARPPHIYKYFLGISESTNLPLILFNAPNRSGVCLENNFIYKITRDIDQIIGIKEASGDMFLVANILKDSKTILNFTKVQMNLFYQR